MTLRGHVSREILKLHEAYGDVVRIAPNDLSFLTPDAWKDIMGHRQHDEPELGKDRNFYPRPQFSKHSINVSDRENHTRFRRILSHAFSEKSMREQEPLIQQHVDLLIQRLHANCSGRANPLNMVSWYNWTTFDIIGNLAFGEPFDCLKNSSYHPWVSLIFENVKMGLYLQCARRFPILRMLLRIAVPEALTRARETHFRMTAEKVSKRLATETQRPDFMTIILNKEGEIVTPPGRDPSSPMSTPANKEI